MPWRQSNGLLQEAELGVIKSESLVDDVWRWLHVHLADGHRLPVFCSESHLERAEEAGVVESCDLSVTCNCEHCDHSHVLMFKGSFQDSGKQICRINYVM